MTKAVERITRFAKQESYLWLVEHGYVRVRFGWIIQIKEDSILFKDDEMRNPIRIEFIDIENMGGV